MIEFKGNIKCILNNFLVIFILLLGACNSASIRSVQKKQSPQLAGYFSYIPTVEDADSLLLFKFKTLFDSLNYSMSKVVFYNQVDFIKGDSSHGLDSFFVQQIVDFAKQQYHNQPFMPAVFLFNTGGLRQSLLKGEVTKGHIYELMPFDNQLVLGRVSGHYLVSLHQKLIERKGDPYWILDAFCHNQSRSIAFDVNQIDSSHYYYLLTSDFILAGGDRILDKQMVDVINSDSSFLIRDVLLKQLLSN